MNDKNIFDLAYTVTMGDIFQAIDAPNSWITDLGAMAHIAPMKEIFSN